MCVSLSVSLSVSLCVFVLSVGVCVSVGVGVGGWLRLFNIGIIAHSLLAIKVRHESKAKVHATVLFRKIYLSFKFQF